MSEGGELDRERERRAADTARRLLEDAGRLWDAVGEQKTVGDVLRAVGALDPSDAVFMVFERAIRDLADRTRPSSGG